MPDDKIYNLWNNIRKYDSKFTVPIEQFRSDMAVDENRKRMHGNMIKNLPGFNVPYDQFSADMGYAGDREGFDVSVTTKPSPDPKPVAKPSMVINKPSLYDTPTVVEQTGWGTPKQKPKEAFEREVIAPGTPIRLASDAEWDADVVEKETAGMTYEQIRAEAAKKRDDVADVRALNKSTSLYEKAWQLNPNDASNPLQIAYNYERLGNIDKALENVNASVSLYEQQTKPGVTDMGNPAAYQMKSRLELMKGDYSSSLSSAQRSIQLQGYALEPDEMSEKNEEAYHNMAVSANYGMTAAEKLGDKDLAEKYKKVYTDASDYSSKIVGAKNLELTRQYISSGQFTKDIAGQIPIMRNVLGVAESMEGFRDAAYDGHILKAVVNTFHAGFAGGMLFNPVAEGEFYLLEKLTPSKYMNMIMQPVSSVAGAFNIKVDDRDQWYKLGDIVGSIILLGAGHKAIKSGLSSTKDYAALKSEADLARNIVESKPLTEAEVKAAEKFIGEAPPEVVKTVLEKKYKESEIKTEEGKPDELKPLEPKLEEVRPEEVRSEEAIPKELKPEDVRPEELKPEEAKADELRPEEVRAEELKPEEVRTEELKPEEVRTEELKPEEVRTDELKPEEVRTDELKPEEVRSEEVRPEEPIRAETSPVEKPQAEAQGNIPPANNTLNSAAGAMKRVPIAKPTSQLPKGAKPKLLSQMIADLTSVLGGKISVGKTRAKNILGTYTPSNSLRKLKKANSIITAAHENAHFLDDKFKVLDGELGNAKLIKELDKHYDKGVYGEKPLEGFAGWMEDYILNPEQARANAPEIAKLYDRKVAAKDRAAVDAFSEDVRRFADSSAGDKYGAIIETEVKPTSGYEKLKKVFGIKSYRDFQKNYLTVFEPLRNAWRDALKEIGKSESTLYGRDNFATMLKFMFGSDERFNINLEKGLGDVNFKPIIDVKTGMRKTWSWIIGSDLKLPGADHSLVINTTRHYMAAKRTIEFARNLREKLYDEAVAKLDERIETLSGENKIKILNDKIANLDRGKFKSDGAYNGVIKRYKTQISILEQQAKLNEGKIDILKGKRESLSPESMVIDETTITGVGGGMFSDIKIAEEKIKEMEEMASQNPRLYDAVIELDRRYKSVSDDILKYYLDSDVLSKEAYDMIKAKNQEYVALQRVMENSPMEGVETDFSAASKIGSVSDLIKEFKGSSRTIIDPYASLLDNMYRHIRNADKNRTMRTFTDVLDAARDMYDGAVTNLASIGYEVMKGDKYDLKVYKNGEPKYYVLNKDLVDGLDAINKAGAQLPLVMTIFQTVLKKTVTLSPQFLLRNPIRDQGSRLFISQGKTSLKDYTKYGKSKEEYMRAGGGQFGYFERSRESYYKQMKKALKEASADNKVSMIPHKYIKAANPISWYKGLLENSELITRTNEYKSVYRKMKDRGLNDVDAQLEAMRAARELIDFKEIGKNVQALNCVIPFLNPKIQGFRVMIAAIKRNPVKFTTRMLIYGLGAEAVQTAIISSSSDETKERYKQLPAYRKNMFFNIPVGDGWLLIPKPFEYGAIMSAMGRGLDYMFLDDKNAYKNGFTKAVISVMNPIDPSVIRGTTNPITSVISNYDEFRGMHIIPPYEEGVDVELRKGKDKASPIGRGLAVGINKLGGNIDPRLIDFYIKSQFSYFGDMTIKSSEAIAGDKEVGWEATSLYRTQNDLSSNDVSWIWDNAIRYKMQTNKDYKKIIELSDEYNSANSEEEQNRIGLDIIATASAIRKKWEEVDLLEAAKKREAEKQKEKEEKEKNPNRKKPSSDRGRGGISERGRRKGRGGL